MDACLQPLLGDLLDAVGAGLDHQLDVALDRGPPEIRGHPGDRSIHAVVAGQGGAMRQKEGFALEAGG